MTVKPLADRVLVKPVEREEMTKSGIVLPDTAREKPQEGIVEAVGPGRVLDTKYAGNEFKLGDVEYLLVSERDVLAVVENHQK